ncbi:MAG: glycosyltransferase [Thermoanaerobacteraceae bacterium]|nr:glycosyltransferase [Thermoanaerobacteraceae bacterium]
MRVLFTNDVPLLKYGLAVGFEDIGHRTKLLKLCKVETEQQGKVLEEAIEEFKPDFIFSEGHAVGIHLPTLFNTLKKTRVPLVYWAIEDPILYPSFSQWYAEQALLTLTTTVECVPLYKAKGYKVDILLFGCNPRFHRRVQPDEQYRHDIVLVANNYDNRYHQVGVMVKPLVEQGYDIKVWGIWWDDDSRPTRLPDRFLGGVLPYKLLPTVYSSAKIVLGLHCVDSSVTQTSMRTYEVLGCGAFYLTYYTPAHKRLFKYGKHLVWSRSPGETLRLVDYYLQNEKAREEIATAGQQLVCRRDTYTKRARKVIRLVSKLL